MNNSTSLFDLIGLLLEENFGDNDISKIGKELCINGAATILELMKRLKLDYISIRNSLIILVQNKLVTFTEKSRKKENPNVSNIQFDESKETFYEFNIENCLMRLKFPKILFNIKTIYGDIGQMIFEEFFMFGVMNSFQCIEAVFDKMKMTKKMDLNNIKIVFVEMIENNYLTQCANIKIKENFYEDQNIGAKGEKDKKKKKKKKIEIDEKMEEEPKIKLSLITNKVIEDDHILIFNKDKQKPYYFYINFHKIIKDMKIEFIVDMVIQKVSNPQAGVIIGIILRNSLDKDFKNGKSTAISIDEIMKKLPEKHTLKEKVIHDLLTKMKSEENNYVMEWGFNDNGLKTYCVNIDSITHVIKTKTLEKIIEQQFTSNHVRIYRLLSRCGPLDLKNISEICLLSQKETASFLNQMIQENYIEFKEFNKMHFYSINIKNNIEILIIKIYKMIFNLKHRLNYEVEKLKNKDYMKKIEEYVNRVYNTISELDDTILIIKDL